MNRDIPYDETAICDICGNEGAFDFMGDFICVECASKAIERKKKSVEMLREKGW